MFNQKNSRLKRVTLFTLFMTVACGFGISLARADAQSCMNGVGDFIKRTELDISTAELGKALIVCERSGGNLKAAIGVLPTGSQPTAPEIIEFRVGPSRVRPGDFVSFFWRVEDATRVTLSDDFGVLEDSDRLIANGASSIALNETTTFRLVAVNCKGQSDDRTFRVRVISAPKSSDGCEKLPPDQRDKCGG